MRASVRNPMTSERRSNHSPSKTSTASISRALDQESDDDSIVDSDQSDEEESDCISALNNDSLYSADTYAGAYTSDPVGNPRDITLRSTVSPMQSKRSSSTRRTEPRTKTRAYADEEQNQVLATINEECSDDDDGNRGNDEDDSEDDDDSDGSSDSGSSGSSENTSNSEVITNAPKPFFRIVCV